MFGGQLSRCWAIGAPVSPVTTSSPLPQVFEGRVAVAHRHLLSLVFFVWRWVVVIVVVVELLLFLLLLQAGGRVLGLTIGGGRPVINFVVRIGTFQIETRFEELIGTVFLFVRQHVPHTVLTF